MKRKIFFRSIHQVAPLSPVGVLSLLLLMSACGNNVNNSGFKPKKRASDGILQNLPPVVDPTPSQQKGESVVNQLPASSPASSSAPNPSNSTIKDTATSGGADSSDSARAQTETTVEETATDTTAKTQIIVGTGTPDSLPPSMSPGSPQKTQTQNPPSSQSQAAAASSPTSTTVGSTKPNYIPEGYWRSITQDQRLALVALLAESKMNHEGGDPQKTAELTQQLAAGLDFNQISRAGSNKKRYDRFSLTVPYFQVYLHRGSNIPSGKDFGSMPFLRLDLAAFRFENKDLNLFGKDKSIRIDLNDESIINGNRVVMGIQLLEPHQNNNSKNFGVQWNLRCLNKCKKVIGELLYGQVPQVMMNANQQAPTTLTRAFSSHGIDTTIYGGGGMVFEFTENTQRSVPAGALQKAQAQNDLIPFDLTYTTSAPGMDKERFDEVLQLEKVASECLRSQSNQPTRSSNSQCQNEKNIFNDFVTATILDLQHRLVQSRGITTYSSVPQSKPAVPPTQAEDVVRRTVHSVAAPSQKK